LFNPSLCSCFTVGSVDAKKLKQKANPAVSLKNLAKTKNLHLDEEFLNFEYMEIYCLLAKIAKLFIGLATFSVAHSLA
jgi:hypothetical protein